MFVQFLFRVLESTLICETAIPDKLFSSHWVDVPMISQPRQLKTCFLIEGIGANLLYSRDADNPKKMI